MPPCPAARSTSSRIRFLSSALNLRRCAFSGTSGSGELAAKGTTVMASLTMILLAALLCNYGRGFCLIDVGTEGTGALHLMAETGKRSVVSGCNCNPESIQVHTSLLEIAGY